MYKDDEEKKTNEKFWITAPEKKVFFLSLKNLI